MRGPREFGEADVELVGPFRAVGSITEWHFSGEVEVPDVGDYSVEFHAERKTLTNLVNTGIGIYCISNRCRSRYLTHANQPTLVAAIVGIGHDDGAHYVGLVTLERPQRRSAKRLKRGSGNGWGETRRWSDLESPNGSASADFACPRCQSKGRAPLVTTPGSGTM